MANNLQNQIETLNVQYTEAAQALRQKVTEAEGKRNSLRKKLELLREELAQVDEVLHTDQEALDDLPRRFQQETVGGLVTGALLQCQNEIYERLTALQQTPGQRQQLLLAEQPLRLVLIMISNMKEAEITWVLPLPPGYEAYPVEIADLLDELREQCLYVILRVGQHIDWFYAGMADDTPAWQGFASVATLYEYTGNESMVTHAQNILQKQFDQLLSSKQAGPFQGLRIVVEVAALGHEIREWSTTAEVVAQPEPEKEPSEFTRPLFERSGGWYRDEDVISWERPVKSAEGSNWSVQARRLRTALIGLLARGYMGPDYVEQQLLWRPLPSPHQEAMKQGVGRLLKSNILLEATRSSGNGEPLVYVNPAMVNRVQDLINRQVDDDWREIVSL